MGATGSYANSWLLPANPELGALGRGWSSGTGASELAPGAGGAGPGSFKPHAKGLLRLKSRWRPTCLCRGLCVCPWNTPPVLCAWLESRLWWTFMGKSQKPGELRAPGADPELSLQAVWSASWLGRPLLSLPWNSGQAWKEVFAFLSRASSKPQPGSCEVWEAGWG